MNSATKNNLKLAALLIGGFILAGTAISAHPSLDTYEGYGSCKSCHDNMSIKGQEAGYHADEMMATIHWNWETVDSYTGETVGKYNVINNYCVAVPSNEPRCTSCHIGIGWSDTSWDPSANRDKMDCLVCHDTTGTYTKAFPNLSGNYDPTIDIANITANVGKPDRDNCGACHFKGGGGDGVKHGTLDTSMANPSDTTDIHMGPTNNMDCADCHIPGSFDMATKDATVSSDTPHAIVGSRYSKATNDAALCQDCHTSAPHAAAGGNSFMDVHAQNVACQTCHVPALARGGKATKMYWDWSTAGDRIDNGDGTFADRVIKDADGNIVYHSKKGTFIWEENVIPEYTWFNGNVDHAIIGDTVMLGQIFKINELQGSKGDGLIFPVKRFVGIQPFDMGSGTIAVPHLFPTAAEKAGEAAKEAYWMKYDWELALAAGQNAVGLSYTGPVGWVESEYTWVANHMVAPADDVVQCWECHNPYGRLDFAALGYGEDAGRLQNLMASLTWRGYEIQTGDLVDTGDWLGMLYVADAPWVYSYELGKFIYIPDNVDPSGAWMYAMD